MNIKKTAIVVTTINLPTFIEPYFENFQKYNVKPNEVIFIVVGDRKSHKQSKWLCEQYKEYPVEYWDIDAQEKWIKDTFPDKTNKANYVIPFDSPRRRNFGFLRALELGADVTITIDDDNLPTKEDWLNGHLDAFRNRRYPLVSSQNYLVNPCRMLDFNRIAPIYSRGYPISEMFSDTFTVARQNDKRVVLNMGLWVNKPDVDAYTNIAYLDLESIDMKEGPSRYAIYKDNYFPINTQNTSFLTELTPIFCALYMSWLYGLKLDRYDDIWLGWIFQKLMHKMGDTATFGIPLTNHERNVHNFTWDLRNELIGIALNKKVFDMVSKMELKSTNYIDGYLEIANKLKNIPVADYGVGTYFKELALGMEYWIEFAKEWL